MYAIIARDDLLESWLLRNPTSDEVREVVRTLRGGAIVLSEMNRREAISQMQGFLKGAGAQIWTEGIRNIPWARVKNPRQYNDPLLDIQDYASISDLLRSDDWDKAVEHHKIHLSSGESRNLGFERLVGHLLPSATSVEYMDSYIGEMLANKKGGSFEWLFSEMLSRINSPIRLVTAISAKGTGSLTQEELRLRAWKTVEHLTRLVSKYSVSTAVYLDLYEKAPHNRYLTIKVQDQALVRSFEHGSEIFKTDPISTPQPINAQHSTILAGVRESPEWLPKWNEPGAVVEVWKGLTPGVVVKGPRWLDC